MATVRIVKNFGFEQPGEIVDYRNVDLDDRLLAGDVELLVADERQVEEPVEEAVEEPVVDEPTAEEEAIIEPVVTKEKSK